MDASVDLLDIKTPLPPGTVKIVGIEGSASLSAPFAYTATLRAGLAMLDADKLLYQPVTVTIAQGGPHLCYLNGLVLSVTQMPADAVGSELLGDAAFWDYRIVIVPKLQFLAQTSDCGFFENLSSVDIAKLILNQFGVTDSEFRVSGEPPARPYTVMFNESYLAFFDRILAADGLFYFFEHSDGKHTLVVGNFNMAFTTLPPVMFAGQSAIEAGIEEWRRTDETAVGKSMVADYNPTAAATRIADEEPTILKAPGASDRAHYRWPAFAPDSGTAAKVAKRHMQAHEVRARLYAGTASIPDLYVGGKFTLTGDPTAAGKSSDYILRAVALAITDQGGAVTDANKSGVSLSLTAFPAATPWRPEPLPKPAMNGFYSATVIGPNGEEIYTDNLGRIKVQFPWDHRNTTTPSGSFWLRVVQPWSGPGWGAQFIPRVGQEVAVTFLEGDIDRPVAVGALYNSTNTPIFPVAQQTKSGFRSRSTKGGGAADYNEFSFDDAKGSEVVLLHAQKDHVIEVEHDQTVTVDHDQTMTVKHDQTMTIDNCRTVTVKKNEAITIQGSQTVKVTQSVLYQSDQAITLKVGDNTIKIDQSGITVTAMKIKFDGQTMLESSAPMTKLAAAGIMTIQGGLVKVN